MSSMLIHNITELTQDEIIARIENHPIVFLAPRFRSRNALLTYFIESDVNTYFYALSEPITDFAQFLQDWVEASGDFDPKFGANTTQALAHRGAKVPDLVDAFAADIVKARPKPRYLIVDNFDQLTIS